MKDPHEPDSFNRKHWEARLNLVSPGPDAKEIKCDSPKCKKKVGVAKFPDFLFYFTLTDFVLLVDDWGDAGRCAEVDGVPLGDRTRRAERCLGPRR